MERNEYVGFPEAPNLMAMVGMFGKVNLEDEFESKGVLSMNVLLDDRFLGTLFYDLRNNSLGYWGRLPTIKSHLKAPAEPEPSIQDAARLLAQETILYYDFNNKRRKDEHPEILFP